MLVPTRSEVSIVARGVTASGLRRKSMIVLLASPDSPTTRRRLTLPSAVGVRPAGSPSSSSISSRAEAIVELVVGDSAVLTKGEQRFFFARVCFLFKWCT